MKTYQIILLVLIVLTFLFLDRCTSVNISTSPLFKNPKYNSFKYLKDGVSSENYETIRLEKARYPILYDTIQNTFYVNCGNGICKIDGDGNIILRDSIFKDEANSLVDFANHSYYVFTKDAVYDYSQKEVRPEKMASIVNENNDMAPEEWESTFAKLYAEAQVVIYESDRYTYEKCNCYPIYFKIGEKWTLMYTDKNDFRSTLTDIDMESYIGRADFKEYLPKYNGLIALRDNSHKMYSDKMNTSDEFLKTYYTVHMKEENFKYESEDKLKTLFFQKQNVYSEAAYTSIPLAFGGIAYYELSLGKESLYFKENASKDSGLASSLNSNLYFFEIPAKFRNQTEVRFLDFRAPSNVFLSGSEDLYIIRRKKK